MSILARISPTNAKISVEYFLKQLQLAAVPQYGQGYTADILTIYIEKDWGFWGSSTDAEDAIDRHFDRFYRRDIARVCDSLPYKVSLQIEKHEDTCNRHSGSGCTCLYYKVRVQVGREASNAAFSSVAVDQIVHASASSLSSVFLQEATQFCERVLLRRNDVVKDIVNRFLMSEHPISICIGSNSISTDNYSVRYSEYGLNHIEKLEQQYGLAMAIAKERGCRAVIHMKDEYVLRIKRTFVYLEVYPQVKQKPIPLKADW